MSLIGFTRFALVASLACWSCSVGSGADETPDAAPPATSAALCTDLTDSDIGPDYPKSIHAVGSHLEDSTGNAIVLRGINRSGTEYRCIQNAGFFDGPCNEASVQAIASWNVNAVRVPLNETCWLDINDSPANFSGEKYKASLLSYVRLLHKYKLVPILELHWAAAGLAQARLQQPMPNMDHTPDFWRDVAATFKDDEGVVFEPYNEPFPDRNRDTDAAWQCWRDGCSAPMAAATGSTTQTYMAAGMQSLVDTIRSTGATQLILLGGIQYSNTLTQWLAYKPNDPLNNLGAAWHIYSNNPCQSASCWNGPPLSVTSAFPIVATEIGEFDCEGTFISPLMDWLDQHGSGYLAWSWNVGGACNPGSRTTATFLIADYASGTPVSSYARTFRDRLMAPQ